MPENSPILGLPYVTENDFAADYPGVDSARTLGLELFSVPRFVNEDARGAVIPDPVPGMLTVLTQPTGDPILAPRLEMWQPATPPYQIGFWSKAVPGRAGAYAVATGSWSAGAVGENIIPLTSFAAQRGAPWAIDGGAVVVPWAGVWLSVYFARTTAGSFSQVWMGGAANLADNIHLPSGTISARAANYTTIGWLEAGSTFSKPIVYAAPNPGSAGSARLTIAYLGNDF